MVQCEVSGVTEQRDIFLEGYGCRAVAVNYQGRYSDGGLYVAQDGREGSTFIDDGVGLMGVGCTLAGVIWTGDFFSYTRLLDENST